ncbi:hypothetical protein BJ684DRAFT_20302, partial [Piptocephalis cylindrospora]
MGPHGDPHVTPSPSSSQASVPRTILSPAPVEIGDRSYSYSSVHAPPASIQLPKIVTAMTSISVMDDVPHPTSTQRLPSISTLTTNPFASRRINSVGIGRSSSSSAALDRPFDRPSSSLSHTSSTSTSTSTAHYHPYDRE